MRLLVGHPDEAVQQDLQRTLSEQGFDVRRAHSGSSVTELARANVYDAIIIAETLPDVGAAELAASLRQQRVTSPILVHGRDDTAAIVRALDAGADDYVVASITEEELLARVRALVRRGRGSGGALLRCGRLEMDVASRTVRVGGQRLHMTPREFAVLEFLLRNQQGVVPRSVLHERIWGAEAEESSSNVVDVYISRLRRKLRANHANGLIQSVHGTGYILGLESEPDVTMTVE